MSQMWNDRYGKEEYAYGELPNEYLKASLLQFEPGKILFPAEGEGRNAVHAATLGWEVYAFDQSVEGQRKAMKLAERKHVKIDYWVGEFQDLPYAEGAFDAMALIFAHFPANEKSRYHKILTTYLRPGGTLIFEAFSKTHLRYNQANPAVGGPKEEGMLFSVEEIQHDFDDFVTMELLETEVDLKEGAFHNGTGSVIRFRGIKK